MNKHIKTTFDHHYKLSKAGYLHFPMLGVSFGSNGMGAYLLGFSFTIAISKNK